MTVLNLTGNSTYYYGGCTITKGKNQMCYSINGVLTTYITIEQVKSFIDSQNNNNATKN